MAFAREAFSSPDVDVAAADADIATLELAGVDPRRTPALAFRAFDDDACARLGVIGLFRSARATMEKVFLRIAGGEEGLAQSRLGREIAEMLQAEADDEAQRELDAVVFSEATLLAAAVSVAAPGPLHLILATDPYFLLDDGHRRPGTLRMVPLESARATVRRGP